jgi:hypothetical protein
LHIEQPASSGCFFVARIAACGAPDGYWSDASAGCGAGPARRSSHASTGGVTIAVSRDIATMIA